MSHLEHGSLDVGTLMTTNLSYLILPKHITTCKPGLIEPPLVGVPLNSRRRFSPQSLALSHSRSRKRRRVALHMSKCWEVRRRTVEACFSQGGWSPSPVTRFQRFLPEE